MVKKVVMPAAGQTTDIATVTKLMVAVGDAVKKGDVLLEVETDKAVLPIESFAKGLVTEIFVNEFDKVDAGTPLLAIGDAADLEAAKNKTEEAPAPLLPAADEDEDDFAPVMPASAPAPAAVAPAAPAPTPTPVPVQTTVSGKAMPNAKKLAAELGVDLNRVTPSNGLFIKASDVKKAAENAKTESKPVDEDYIPQARMRSTLARRWEAYVPTFTVSVSASDAAYQMLAAREPSVTPAHYVVAVLAKLALRYPILRAQNNGKNLPLSAGAHIGFGIFAENGTVSTVIADAEKRCTAEIAALCDQNTAAVCTGDLSTVYPCPVSVYDVTAYGVEGFSMPVSAPGVASFGVTHKNGKIGITACFDIRVVEGNVGASVMADLCEFLENPVLMI